MSTPPGGTERERRLAELRVERQRSRQQLQERRQRTRRVTWSALAAVAVVAGLVVLVPKVTGGAGASAVPTPTASTRPCVYTPDASTNPVVTTRPTPVGFGTRRNATATMITNQGTIVISLLTTDAPCATTSFGFLSNKKYFDGSTCSRLTTESGLSFLQCGDPAKGTGPGYVFPDENLSPSTTYPQGTVAMANRAENSNGSEFFLCYGDSQLPPQFVPFGRITSGLDVLKRVAAGGAAPSGDGAPLRVTTITSLRTTGL